MIWKVYDKTGQTVRCEIHKLEYNGTWMGECFVSATIKSLTPIDFAIGDYLEYRNERFEINYDPSALKKGALHTNGESFVYDNVKFNSLSDELTRCDFLDYVKNDNNIHFTSLPKFSFYALSIQDLADRIQVNLDRIYTGEKKWTIEVHPEYVSKTDVNISVDNIKVWDALALVNSQFKANFIIRGRVITIGTAGIAVDNVFMYGKGKGLYEIQRTAESDQQIITRLRAYGSTRNLPNRYYNKLSGGGGNYLPDNMAVMNLMLPGFPEKTLDPYIDSKNIEELGIREGTVFFDGSDDEHPEIYPSMEGMTAEDLKEAGVPVQAEGNLDEVVSAEQISDNGQPDEDGKIGKGTFTITIKDIGFDINDYLTASTATISMKSGACGGREFEIVECKKSGNNYVLTCNRAQDGSLNLYFPYKDYNIQPGDKFVLLNIEMPDVYIKAASQRLLDAAKEYLSKNDYVRYSYEPKVDDIYMARQHDEAIETGGISIHDTIKEGDIFLFNDTDLGIDGSITIDSLTIKEGESIIPQYEIVLREEKVVGTIQKIQNQIDSIAGGQGGGGYNAQQIRSLIKAYGELLFLSKTKPDTTNFLLNLLGGVKVGKNLTLGDFITGVSGGMIDEKGNMEMESGYFRKRLFVPELAYNRITYFKGRAVLSPGGGCKVKSFVKNEDGSFTVTPDLTDADGLSQFVDDILSAYFTTKNAEGKLTGFAQMQFRVTEADYEAKTFKMVNRPGQNYEPGEEMVLAQTGNFTDPERQTYILFDSVNGNNCITFFDHANTWDPEPSQMPAWFGKKKGMVIQGIDADNYSAVLQNIIMTGLIFQIDSITGGTVRVPLDKGAWKAGKYAYYDRVSHNGALWLCVNPEGTETEPDKKNTDWLKQVSEGQKGDKGDPGLSVVGGGHWESSKVPYAANTMVTLANCVFLSKKETSNPPISIAKFKGGSYVRMKNGGYILKGKSADWTVHPDWDMLLDGRELKGTSIKFLGSFATAPANPEEGNAYYNTKDRCAYIYQDGTWMVMVPGGKDGKDYEWIYTRNNSIGTPPDRPESEQTDDYVPEGWTDDMQGVSETFQVEWACKRTKKDGVWSDWSNPAVMSRWSKDGENAVIADLDNEMVNCALTSDGKASKAQSWATNVTMWYGYEELPLTSLTATQPSGFTVTPDKATGRVSVSVNAGTAVSETTNIEITLTSQKNGQNFERKLTFTIAGVRAGLDGANGKPGADAVLYSLLPSVSSVKKDKDGNYSVSTVSCKRQKTVGGMISDTTDGELKYSLDGGGEKVIQDGQGVSVTTFTRTLKFVFYVSGKLVDVETIPLLVDGTDGTHGEDGIGIEMKGHWEASKVPYKKNNSVRFGRGSFVALRNTSNPPLAIAKFKGGAYVRTKKGYILAGRSSDMQVHADWQLMSWNEESDTLYWLDCPIAAFSYTSTGNASPSSVEVTCKMSRNGSVSDCTTLWLAARKYNGSWEAHVSARQSSKIGVPAAAGYTQFTVRAYTSQADANAWNGNYVAERGIGVAQAGKDGTNYEHIFQRTTTNTRPQTPATSQQDNYVPEGWTRNPQGVSETYPYEWASMRLKNDKVWGDFCTPYPYGVKGKDGATGPAGAFPYDCGVFKEGKTYVWNATRRDKVIFMFGGVYYNYLVKNFGASVTVAPSKQAGDDNWELMQEFQNIATDTFFADGANIAGFMFKRLGTSSDGTPYGELRSQNTNSTGVPVFSVNTKTGKLTTYSMSAYDVYIEGEAKITKGSIGGFTIADGRIGSTYNGSLGELSITRYTIAVGDSQCGVVVGRNAIPVASGETGAAWIENRQKVNTVIGAYVVASNGTSKNIGIRINVAGSGAYGIDSNAPIKAPSIIGTDGSIVQIFSGGYGWTVDFARYNIFLCTSTVDISLNMPTESQVRTMFGLSSLPTNFVMIVTFKCLLGSHRITLKSIYDRNENSRDYTIAPGDSIQIMISKVDGFRYNCINYNTD